MPSVLPERLFEALVRAATAEARYALELYTEEDSVLRIRAALSAGSAVEALLKGVLTQTLPGLLADRGDVHTQLMLSGLSGVRGKTYLDCRTIGGLDASRVLSAVAASLSLDEDVKCVLTARNAAAHLAILTRPDLSAAIRSLVSVVEALLPAISLASEAFWGPVLYPHAQLLQQETVDQRLLLIAEAKSAAHVRLARLRSAGESAFEAMVEVLDAYGRDDEIDGEFMRKVQRCPVCGYSGWLSGFVDRGPLCYEVGDDYTAEEFWVDRTFESDDFTCDVCTFHLSTGELALEGLPVKIELERDYNPRELREEAEDYWAQMELDRMRGK